MTRCGTSSRAPSRSRWRLVFRRSTSCWPSSQPRARAGRGRNGRPQRLTVARPSHFGASPIVGWFACWFRSIGWLRCSPVVGPRAICARDELRLIIIANQQEVVGGRRQQQGIGVLNLVNEEVRAAPMTRSSKSRPPASAGPPRRRRTPGRSRRCGGRRRRSRRRRRRRASAAKIIVARRRHSAAVARGTAVRGTVSRSSTGAIGCPASRRISRLSAWNVRIPHAAGRPAERVERRVEALCKLFGGAAVEGDRRDRRRLNFGRDEPRDPRAELWWSAAARWSDAQHSTGRRRGRSALVGSSRASRSVTAGCDKAPTIAPGRFTHRYLICERWLPPHRRAR